MPHPTAIEISTSGLVAQRTRMNVIASNIANVSTTRDVDGAKDADGNPQPYIRKRVIFRTGLLEQYRSHKGVRVSRIEDDRPDELGNDPFRLQYEPGHPDANDQGYVRYPNIDLTKEYVNALEASQAYQLNIQAIDISKAMNQQVARLLE